MTKIYLAHSGQEKERGVAIQTELEKFGYKVINPFHKENPYIHDLKWENGKVIGILSKSACKWVVETDLQFIDECDIVVMIYPNNGNTPTIGTPCEMMYSWMVAKKPLYIYVPEAFKEHPWIKYMATKAFTSIFDLLDCMRDLIL